MQKDMDITPRVEYERDERTKQAVMDYVNSGPNSPQTNSLFENQEEDDVFSSSDDEDLDPATLAAMRDAYAGMSGGNTDDIKKNEKFNLNNVTLRRPETGLHPNYLSKILGKKSKRFLKADQKIKFLYK